MQFAECQMSIFHAYFFLIPYPLSMYGGLCPFGPGPHTIASLFTGALARPMLDATGLGSCWGCGQSWPPLDATRLKANPKGGVAVGWSWRWKATLHGLLGIDGPKLDSSSDRALVTDGNSNVPLCYTQIHMLYN